MVRFMTDLTALKTLKPPPFVKKSTTMDITLFIVFSVGIISSM